MSLANFTDLKSAIARWLKREDLTADIPDFITLAESRLNKHLRLLQMEQSATVTLTSGNNYADLPTGFLDHIDLYYTSDNCHPDKKLLADVLKLRPVTGSNRPGNFAISSLYEFDAAADQTYTLKAYFLKKWSIAADSTNWLLTNHPNTYLFASLEEAAPFLKNDMRIPVWMSKAQGAIDEVNRLDDLARSTELSFDAALLSTQRNPYDILTGQ